MYGLYVILLQKGYGKRGENKFVEKIRVLHNFRKKKEYFIIVKG